MQEAMIAPVNADRLRSSFELKPFALGDQCLSSPQYFAGSGDDALFHCSSPFSPSFGFSSPSPHATSVSLSPSSSSASLVDDSDAAAAADDVTGHRLQLARLALQYQEVADRYELCLARLAEAVDEAAALRRKNAELRVANGDLARRLALFGGKQDAAVAVDEEIRRLRRCEQQSAVPFPAECAPPEKLAVLPKSISVRSKDYLKMNLPAMTPATPVFNNRKPGASNPTVSNHGSVSLCSVPALPLLANSRVHNSDT
jgi:butyrate response factor